MPFDFYEISFFVSQLRSFNRRFSQGFLQLPFPSIANLPAFFYRIYLPCSDSHPLPLNSSMYEV